MELDFIEKDKNRLKFEIKGEGNSFCNILKREMWDSKDIEISGYKIKHSLISQPLFTIQVAKGDPKKTVLDAVERLKKRNSELIQLFKSLS